MSKGSVYLDILFIGRVINIWDVVLCKFRESFDGLINRKEVISESIHRIESYLDVVVEVLEIHISVSFEFCLDE